MSSYAKIQELWDHLTYLDQVALVQELIEKIEMQNNQDLPKSWLKEIKKRGAALKRGEIEPLPWRKIFASLR